MSKPEEKPIEKGFNLELYDFQEALASLINNAKLPLICKQGALINVLAQIAPLADKAITDERIAYETALKTVKLQ